VSVGKRGALRASPHPDGSRSKVFTGAQWRAVLNGEALPIWSQFLSPPPPRLP